MKFYRWVLTVLCFAVLFLQSCEKQTEEPVPEEDRMVYASHVVTAAEEHGEYSLRYWTKGDSLAPTFLCAWNGECVSLPFCNAAFFQGIGGIRIPAPGAAVYSDTDHNESLRDWLTNAPEGDYQFLSLKDGSIDPIDWYDMNREGAYAVAFVYNPTRDELLSGTNNQYDHYAFSVWNADDTLRYEYDFKDFPEPYREYAPKTAFLLTDSGEVIMEENKLSDKTIRFWFWDADGSYRGKFELPRESKTVRDCGLYKTAGGDVFYVFEDYAAATVTYYPVDTGNMTFGAPVVYENIVESRGVYAFSPDGTLYVSDGLSLYRFRAGAAEKLFDWTEQDVVGRDIVALYVRGENAFTAVTKGSVSDIPEIVYIDYVWKSTLPEKTEIVIAAGMYSDGSSKALQTAVKLFNRRSEAYHASVRYYEAQTDGMFTLNQRVARDIANGEKIDLIFFHGDLTMELFEHLGILGDWYPMLDRDSEYGRDAFLPCILNAYENASGQLPVLTTDFAFATLVGMTGNLNGMTRWDYAQCKDFVQQLSADTKLVRFASDTPDESPIAMQLLHGILPVVLDDYIDDMGNAGMFDSERFEALLDLCMAISPERHTDDAGKTSDAAEQIYRQMDSMASFRAGKVVLYNSDTSKEYGKYSVTAPSSVLNILDNFYKGEEVTFIGYPTIDGAGDGTAVVPEVSFGLVSTSANQSGAWEMMKGYFTFLRERNQTLAEALPCTWEALDAQLDHYDAHMYCHAGGPTLQESEPFDNPKDSPYYNPNYLDPNPAARAILKILAEETVRHYSGNTEVMDIIYEEASACFAGVRSTKETAALIQNRVTLLLNEAG